MSLLLLVRHGQASFGAEDYDVLSGTGHRQARLVGEAIAARGIVPDVVVQGRMLRHRETTEGLLEGLLDAGARPGGEPPPVEVDPRWDEFDFRAVLDVHLADAPAGDPDPDRPQQSFQELFDTAVAGWVSGHRDGYPETFAAFSERVADGLAALRERSERVIVVVTSGGPIGVAASHVVSGGPESWTTFNRLVVNASLTKVISGRRGLHLASFNEQGHLEGAEGMLTYR